MNLLLPEKCNFLGLIERRRPSTPASGPCHTSGVKTTRKQLGRFIVADAKICRGKPTFKGTRGTVSDVLADLERGLSWDFICYRWGDGKITREARRWN